MSEGLIPDSCRKFYEQFQEKFAVTEEVSDLPPWDDLGPDQVDAWIATFAATIEVSRRVAKALLLTTGTTNGAAL